MTQPNDEIRPSDEPSLPATSAPDGFRGETGAVSLDVGPATGQAPARTIRPRRRWSPPELREIWEFRDLLMRFAAKDVILRYRQTALGVVWVILQPVLTAGVFTFVFGDVAGLKSGAVPYFVFAFAGQVAWNAFNTIITRSSGALVLSSALVSKIYFPRLLLPLSVIFAALIDASVAFVMMLIILLISGVPITLTMLSFPFWLLFVMVLAEGCGIVASSLMVRYRDVQYVLPVLVQLLLFASPVAYSLSSVPKHLQGFHTFLVLNPLTGLLQGVRWSLLGAKNAPIELGLSLYATSASVLILIVGMFAFAQMERSFADVI
jgi:lipopolysaccharide transport system permease protein